MIVEEFLNQIQVLEEQIQGCDNLIDFYINKKKQLLIQKEKLFNTNIHIDNLEKIK